jgi:hypothetical protein
VRRCLICLSGVDGPSDQLLTRHVEIQHGHIRSGISVDKSDISK